MTDILIGVLMTIGAMAILIAAIGIVRMPDFYLRLSVTVKAATLGIGLLLASTAVYFPDSSLITSALAIVFFLILTAPVAAHMIGRSAYLTGTQLWEHSVRDDLKDMFDKDNQYLRSEHPDHNDPLEFLPEEDEEAEGEEGRP